MNYSSNNRRGPAARRGGCGDKISYFMVLSVFIVIAALISLTMSEEVYAVKIKEGSFDFLFVFFFV